MFYRDGLKAPDASAQRTPPQAETPEPASDPYRKLIAETFSSNLGSAWREQFALTLLHALSSNHPAIVATVETLRSAIAGQSLIDLGAGDYCALGGYPLAKFLRAEHYVAVDKFATPRLAQDFEVRSVDMLEYLARLTPGTHNFALNGIDSFVITGDRYHDAVAREMTRVTRPGNVAFGIVSDILDHLELSKWDDASPRTRDGAIRVFIRK